HCVVAAMTGERSTGTTGNLALNRAVVLSSHEASASMHSGTSNGAAARATVPSPGNPIGWFGSLRAPALGTRVTVRDDPAARLGARRPAGQAPAELLSWMAEHHNAIMATVLVVLGAKYVGDAIGGL